MQGSAPTCTGRSAADSMIQNVHFNHPPQGNSTNYYIILDPREKAAPHKSTNRAIPSKARAVQTLKCHPFVFFFLPYPQESSALSQSEAMFVELGECSQNMLSEAFWTPNIAWSQFDECSQLGSRNKSVPHLRAN